jgi:hypothetical protein
MDQEYQDACTNTSHEANAIWYFWSRDLSFADVYAAHQVGVVEPDAIRCYLDGAPSGWARAWGDRL